YIVKDINSYSLLEKIIEVAKIYKFKHCEPIDDWIVINKLITCANNINRSHAKIVQMKNDEILTKSHELESKSHELDMKLEELHVMYNSNSWKITAPLRKIMSLFRR
ncbi:MAG TPA: hypothetical protein VKR58_13345, partial [Aquella sp.]|nr:hypothetical protein [Aquella sp.]